MNAEEIPYTVLLTTWKRHLWTGGDTIFPMDSQQYMGVIDHVIEEKYSPSYFGVRHFKYLIGVLSGHQTTEKMYRIRGFFVDPPTGGSREEITNALLSYATDMAKNSGCKFLWDIIDDNSTLLDYGFIKTSRARDGRYYAIKRV